MRYYFERVMETRFYNNKKTFSVLGIFDSKLGHDPIAKCEDPHMAERITKLLNGSEECLLNASPALSLSPVISVS